MSIFTEAQVEIFLCDFANNDAAGKLNVIGGGIGFVGANPGSSAPFTVAVAVRVPAKFVNSSYSLTVELHDVTTGQLFKVPGPPSGQLEPLRAQQVVTVTAPQLPQNVAVPDDIMIGHHMLMNFTGGLPLPQGHSFEWRAQIDGQHLKGWFYRFHMLGPAPGIVFGGPSNPSNIPGVGEYIMDPPADPAANPPDKDES